MPVILSLSGIRFDHITTEKLVHLTIAIQDPRSASFTCLGEDEHFVGHRVKQIHELLLLELADFDSHEKFDFCFVIHIDDGFDSQVQEHNSNDCCWDSVFVVLVLNIGLSDCVSHIDRLSERQVRQVIYCHEVCAHDVVGGTHLGIDGTQGHRIFENNLGA